MTKSCCRGNIFWGLNKCTNFLLQRRTRRNPRSRIWFTLVWSRSPSPTCSPAGNTERTWLRSPRGWATVKYIETHRIHLCATHTTACCHLTLRWNLWEILKVYTTAVLYYRTRIFKGDQKKKKRAAWRCCKNNLKWCHLTNMYNL